MTYKKFAQDVQVGENILIDDGKLIFKVIETNGTDTVKAETIQGGPLRSKKGVNLPNTNISLPALTEKDKEDAKFAIENRVDRGGLCIIKKRKDVKDLSEFIKENGTVKIIVPYYISDTEASQGDLTRMKRSAELPSGATFSPALTGIHDLEKGYSSNLLYEDGRVQPLTFKAEYLKSD